MAEEEPLAALILEILRRRRRATLMEILNEIFRQPIRPADVERIRRILWRLEIAGLVVRHAEPVRGPIVRYWYYDARPLRRIILRRPGQRLTETELSRLLGIPLAEIPRLVQVALERGWLRIVAPGVYITPVRIFRVQKMRAWRTDYKPELYQVKFHESTAVPRQLVLEGFSSREETTELEIGVHGAVRIVVYTTAPERWPEERLERIMRGLFAQEGITLEIFSDRPYIHTTQAYEAREVDIDEKPPELELDEVDVWLWVSKEEGFTYVYHYTRRPWGWVYERFEAR